VARAQGHTRSISRDVTLQEDQVERLLESAVAKSERPWLILLSGLATVVIALLVFLGLRIDGVF
jgi:hypothetical protein